MTEQEIYQTMEETYDSLSGFRPDAASDTAIRLHTLAMELEKLSARFDQAQTQADPRTAVGNALDLHAKNHGIVRKQPTFAQGSIQFERFGQAQVKGIPKNTVCVTADGVEYRTTESVAFSGDVSTVCAHAKAVKPGENANAVAGAIVRVRQMAGVRAKNPEPFVGGGDAESDDVLRKRLLHACETPNTGCNAAFYRQAAEAFQGVQSAVCCAGEDAGSAVVVVAGKDGKPVPETLLNTIQEQMEQLREPFVKIETKNAEIRPTEVAINVQFVPSATADAGERLAEKIRGFINALGIGQKLTLADLSRILVHSGDAQNWKIKAPANDIEPAGSQVLRAGTVTIEDWEEPNGIG